MATDKFSLCWNNFHNNLSSGFHSLYQSEDFVDVTIAAEGRYLKAHKIVLSVCSQYFKELFQANPCKHPIVILKDVNFCALQDLLQFMYLGEVSVSHEELENLIKVAELLQIKGLTEETVDKSCSNKNSITNNHTSQTKSTASESPSYLKRTKNSKKFKELPAKIHKPNSPSECRSSFTTSTRTDSVDDGVDSIDSSILEPELMVVPVQPKQEPDVEPDGIDFSETGDGYSDHSLPEMDMSSMLDTTLGEASNSTSSLCWKSEPEPDKSFMSSDSRGVLMFTRSRKGMPHLVYDANLFRPSGKIGNSIHLHKYWECVKNRKTGCRARCLIVDKKITFKCRDHNHESPIDYIVRLRHTGAIYYMPV